MRPDHAVALAVLVAVIVLSGVGGAALDRALFREQCQQVVHEPPAPEVRQSDGSVILARDPAATPALPAPKQPAGTVTERVITVTAPGGTPVPVDGPGECPTYECPDVTVRLDLVRDQVGARRVIATSSTGPVIGGIDIPEDPIRISQSYRHSIGLTAYADGAQSVAYARRFGRVTGSVSVLATDGFDAIKTGRDVTPGLGVSFSW